MIPRVAHFVFGLEEQHEPFHFLHYTSIESCRRVLVPEVIYFHHKHLPDGEWWERIRPHVTLVEVDDVEEVLAADYSTGHVPARYRYAHHADFIRLDALIEHGGVYADIDTIFVRPFPDDLFAAPFVIGREPAVRDERTGESRPSLCNALLMAEPGALFARSWRGRMAAALNGTWSNHSGFLSEQLSHEKPSAVRVEPETTFCPFGPNRAGLSKLLEERHAVPAGALSVHLWAHLWWDRQRRDFSDVHSGTCTPSFIGRARTTLADIARSYLPAQNRTDLTPTPSRESSNTWSYLSFDEYSGHGVAADRCMAALEDSGLELDWTPFVPGGGWGLRYEPVSPSRESVLAGAQTPGQVVIAHLTAEYLPLLRAHCPDAFLVGHTVWDTERISDRWTSCLDQANLLVVPSRFSAEAIATSPVTTPVEVVPQVAPPIMERASASWAGIPPDAFVFYTIGDWNERKAIFKTVEAYLRAFRGTDGVLLVVKTSAQDQRVAPAREQRVAGEGTSASSLAQLLARHPDPPAVRLITRSLTNGQMADLHRLGDCFVSLCRCEGWGLGAFDAAAHGNPVVITGFGGQLDYLADSPYLVAFDLVSVEDPVGLPSYEPAQRWADPDVDHGAALLRQVAARPEQAAAVAGSLAVDIRERYRPAAIAAIFRSAVEQHRSGARGDTAATAVRGR
jgi:glycosyltransferase involved in cell wall biosynthesis